MLAISISVSAQVSDTISLYLYTPEKNYDFSFYRYKTTKAEHLLLEIERPIQDPYKLVLDKQQTPVISLWLRCKHSYLPFRTSWIHLYISNEGKRNLLVTYDVSRKRKYRYQLRWLDDDFKKKQLR